jgi:hypothetical protein
VIPAAGAKDTAESIPGAELVIIPGMGHDFPSALVPVYLKHIGDFVAKVEAGRRRRKGVQGQPLPKASCSTARRPSGSAQ